MIIKPQVVKLSKIGMSKENQKHYIDKGYDLNLKEFEVNIEDLTEKSSVKVKIICDYCGVQSIKQYSSISGNKNHFCSKECANNFMKGKSNEKLKNRVKIRCYMCGKELEIIPSRVNDSKRVFCSKECNIKWQKSNEYKEIIKKKYLNDNSKVEVVCNYCGNKFYKYLSASKGEYNFCNADCRNKYNAERIKKEMSKEQIQVFCDNCGKVKYVNESVYKKNKNFFCSKRCYWEWKSKNLKGKNSPLYDRVKVKCDNCGKNIEVIKYDFKKNNHNFCSQECYWEFRSKYYIGEKNYWYGKKNPKMSNIMREKILQYLSEGIVNKQSSIQLKINDLLDELGIYYEIEYICKYFSIDNYLVDYNLMVEVMGDYWHVNPLKYPDINKINDIQKKNIKRDKSKNTYIKKYYNINILYLWESDIRNNIKLCEELIKLYISKNGILEDYNSFNYFLYNDKIYLNDKIILPYFKYEKSITHYQNLLA